ncbi:MAG: hypothetical protein AB7P21_13750 [Lautropia sp.]
MNFYRLLATLAAQIVLGLAAFVWGVIALLDTERAALRPYFAIGAAMAILAIVGLRRGWRWAGVAGAVGVFVPIGLLAASNGASHWLWAFWIVCLVATERWMRDAIGNRPDARTPDPRGGNA